MKVLGVIVNPIAGMGGRVGLKGSDGVEILQRARQLGAVPESPQRAVQALRIVSEIQEKIEVITYPHEMGESECLSAGISPKVIGTINAGETTSEDTERAVKNMVNEAVDLLLFAGGDGTARNVYNALGESLPVIGVPTGVKIHSSVFAVTPRAAGQVVRAWFSRQLMNTFEREVMDIDEDSFRNGILRTRLYGYLRVPEEDIYVQAPKIGGMHTEREVLQGIAQEVIDSMGDDDCYFIIGPGTTTRVIMENLGIKNTLLGVDIVLSKRLVAGDVDENQIMNLIKGKKAKLIVSVIGGQGYIFGRGNQQLSSAVIREVTKENVIVVATKEKLASLSGKALLIDTGDEELDKELSGYVRVTTGFRDYVMYKVGYD